MTTFITASLAFVAGVCVGVFLRENELVTTEDLRHGGEVLVKGVRTAVKKVRHEFNKPDPATT